MDFTNRPPQRVAAKQVIHWCGAFGILEERGSASKTCDEVSLGDPVECLFIQLLQLNWRLESLPRQSGTCEVHIRRCEQKLRLRRERDSIIASLILLTRSRNSHGESICLCTCDDRKPASKRYSSHMKVAILFSSISILKHIIDKICGHLVV